MSKRMRVLRALLAVGLFIFGATAGSAQQAERAAALRAVLPSITKGPAALYARCLDVRLAKASPEEQKRMLDPLLARLEREPTAKSVTKLLWDASRREDDNWLAEDILRGVKAGAYEPRFYPELENLLINERAYLTAEHESALRELLRDENGPAAKLRAAWSKSEQRQANLLRANAMLKARQTAEALLAEVSKPGPGEEAEDALTVSGSAGDPRMRAAQAVAGEAVRLVKSSPLSRDERERLSSEGRKLNGFVVSRLKSGDNRRAFFTELSARIEDLLNDHLLSVQLDKNIPGQDKEAARLKVGELLARLRDGLSGKIEPAPAVSQGDYPPAVKRAVKDLRDDVGDLAVLREDVGAVRLALKDSRWSAGEREFLDTVWAFLQKRIQAILRNRPAQIDERHGARSPAEPTERKPYPDDGGLSD